MDDDANSDSVRGEMRDGDVYGIANSYCGCSSLLVGLHAPICLTFSVSFVQSSSLATATR